MIAVAGCPSSRRAGHTVTLSARVFSWQICCLAVADDDAATLEHCGIGYQKTAHGRCTHPLYGGRPGVCVTGRRPSTWRPTRRQRWRWVGLHHGHWQAGNPIRVACIPQRTGRLAPWAPGDTSQRMRVLTAVQELKIHIMVVPPAMFARPMPGSRGRQEQSPEPAFVSVSAADARPPTTKRATPHGVHVEVQAV